MFTRAWGVTSGFDKGVRVEEHTCRDGSKLYSFRDRHMNPHDLQNEAEAMRLVKSWGMTEITGQLRAAGWIA